MLVAFNVYSQDSASVGKRFSSPAIYSLSEIQQMISYPDSAKKIGLEGKVVIRILVNEDGMVIKDSLMSGEKIFYNEVKKWIYKLRVKPATLNGLPSKCYINVPFLFTLPKQNYED